MPVARAASSDCLGLDDGGRGAGNIEAGDIDIAALRGVSVLHVDHDHRRLVQLEPQRFRASGSVTLSDRVSGVAYPAATGASITRSPR